MAAARMAWAAARGGGECVDGVEGAVEVFDAHERRRAHPTVPARLGGQDRGRRPTMSSCPTRGAADRVARRPTDLRQHHQVRADGHLQQTSATCSAPPPHPWYCGSCRCCPDRSCSTNLLYDSSQLAIPSTTSTPNGSPPRRTGTSRSSAGSCCSSARSAPCSTSSPSG